MKLVWYNIYYTEFCRAAPKRMPSSAFNLASVDMSEAGYLGRPARLQPRTHGPCVLPVFHIVSTTYLCITGLQKVRYSYSNYMCYVRGLVCKYGKVKSQYMQAVSDNTNYYLQR